MSRQAIELPATAYFSRPLSVARWLRLLRRESEVTELERVVAAPGVEVVAALRLRSSRFGGLRGGSVATMVMTGGTSGFGAIAAERLMLSGNARLILGARRPTSVGESIPLDLTELDSGHAFATSVRERLDDTAVDALVLNAGVVRPDATSRTVDGFETTFAVNHLAHYLLLRLLLPALADRAIVVLTTSGTHDPANHAGLAPPRHADAELLAHPDRDPDRDTQPRTAGEHAYTASKLCTVLTARSLSQHPDAQTRRLTVLAYDPGQVFGTGLAKNLSSPLRIVWSLLGTPVLGWPLRRLNRNLNSRTAAGNALADLALGLVTPPNGRLYAALRRGQLTWPDPSELASRDELAQALWNDSARLVGLSDRRESSHVTSDRTPAPQRNTAKGHATYEGRPAGGGRSGAGTS